MLDYLSALPFATHTVSMCVIAVIVGLGLRQLSQDYPLLPFLTMPLVTVTFYLSVGAVSTALGWPVDWDWVFGRVLLPVVILDTVALPFVYLPVYTIRRRTRVEINWQTSHG